MGGLAWKKTGSEKLEKVIKWARGQYQGLNDTHFAEKLQEKEKIKLSTTVRRILRAAGIATVRTRGVTRHYKRRERKAQKGALLLWDGSPHPCFGRTGRVEFDGDGRRRHGNIAIKGVCSGRRHPELLTPQASLGHADHRVPRDH
ncbi:MAG: hypothetical protein HY695_25190 [Deltaproteobacteria bacterium]|nr:hypothetical protein [Deltaproteobacteria bacterium]